MNIGFPILCISLIYSIFLNFMFFFKKHIKTYETKIYSYLLTSNLIGIILEMICTFSILLLGTEMGYVKFVNKIFLLYFLTFASLFNLYVFHVSYSKRKKALITFNSISYVIAAILVMLSPIELNKINNAIYSSGAAPGVIYIISSIYVTLCIIVIFKNYNTIQKKKLIAVLTYIIGVFSICIIQVANPALTLTTSMEAFVMFVMYHTIENPDMKLIEQLNIAKDQADKANNAKTEFLSSMSHEIRTPLNAIVGFSQALLEEDLSEEAKDEVNDIMMASDNLLEIVNGILDISKIEANKLEIINTEYQMDKILKELVVLTKTRIGEKPIDFRCNFDPSIPEVLYGDHARLKQIILNILTNAAKYTKEGFIEFKISSVLQNDICRLIISVEDSGIGIKPDKIDHLFTKFDRLEVEKTVTIEGTGLGLAITKKLVDLMGGTIVVQSVYGQGSKFTVAIDQRVVAMKAEKTEVVEVVKEQLTYPGKKILVVDDNKVNLKVAARLLKSYAVEVETVDSGFLCIEKIQNQEHFDLILMDDMMPKMNGKETFHKLQEIEGFEVPVIALTANAISGMKEAYLKEGFHDYLSKPIDKNELNRVLEKFLK